MKTKVQLFFLAMVLGMACTPTIGDKLEVSLDPLAYKMEEALGQWTSKETALGGADRDRDATWLDVGIRYKYAVLKEFVNPEMMKKVAGVPVFVSGPHTEGIDYNSSEFGHYNPLFLKRVKGVLKTALQREAFNSLAQSIYDSKLKVMTRTYYRAYQAMKKEGDAVEKYGTTYDQEAFRTYADSEEKVGYDWYESVVAPGFWVRRMADGTDATFFELIDMVVKAYDKDFKG